MFGSRGRCVRQAHFKMSIGREGVENERYGLKAQAKR